MLCPLKLTIDFWYNIKTANICQLIVVIYIPPTPIPSHTRPLPIGSRCKRGSLISNYALPTSQITAPNCACFFIIGVLQPDPISVLQDKIWPIPIVYCPPKNNQTHVMWRSSYLAIREYYKSRDKSVSFLISLHSLCAPSIIRYIFLSSILRRRDGESERGDDGSEDDVSPSVFGAQIWALEWSCFRMEWRFSPMGWAGQLFEFDLFPFTLCIVLVLFVLMLDCEMSSAWNPANLLISFDVSFVTFLSLNRDESRGKGGETEFCWKYLLAESTRYMIKAPTLLEGDSRELQLWDFISISYKWLQHSYTLMEDILVDFSDGDVGGLFGDATGYFIKDA